MKLYTFHASSSAYRVRIALNLKGLQPEMSFVNLTKGEHRGTEYASVNTQMIVPTLLLDNPPPLTGGGQEVGAPIALSQSLAIMEYLDEVYPTPPILPKDPVERARVRGLALLIAADIAPLNNLKIRKYLPQFGLSEDDVKTKWIQHWIYDGFAPLEKLLAESSRTGAFCHGDAPTMADCCLVPQVFNARRFECDMARFPNISRIAAQCDLHPAFIAAHPANQTDAP